MEMRPSPHRHGSVTEASGSGPHLIIIEAEFRNEVCHRGRGTKPEFVAQELAARAVLAQRLYDVALEEMNPYQAPVGALPQGLGRHGRQPGLDGLGEPSPCRELSTE